MARFNVADVAAAIRYRGGVEWRSGAGSEPDFRAATVTLWKFQKCPLMWKSEGIFGAFCITWPSPRPYL